jgi:hypothetical protein
MKKTVRGILVTVHRVKLIYWPETCQDYVRDHQRDCLSSGTSQSRLHK